MFIEMEQSATQVEIERVLEAIRDKGWEPIVNSGISLTGIGVAVEPGPKKEEFMGSLEAFPGVARVIPISKPYIFPARRPGQKTTEVRISESVVIGGPAFTLIAGPCAIENREMLAQTANEVKSRGAQVLRGGAYKPRTSRHAFRGLGVDGLVYLKEASGHFGLPTVTEVMEIRDIDVIADHTDILQIGARNAQNFNLLEAVGKCTDKAVLLKNGLAMTIEEFLCAADYVMSQGNQNVILCVRGVRSYDPAVRNFLDFGSIAALRLRTHLPIVVDPSHATGSWDIVAPVAVAAATIADGVMVDVHPNPTKALVDGKQSLTFERFRQLVDAMRPVAEAVGKIWQ